MDKKELMDLKERVLKLKDKSKIKDYLPKMSAYQYLQKCNEDRMDNIALNYLGNEITFKELFKRIDDTAKGFVSIGIKSDDIIGLSALTFPEAIISFYALNKIGAVTHMINPASSKKSISKFISTTDTRYILTQDIFYSEEMKKAYDDAGIEHVITMSMLDSLPRGISSDKIKFKMAEIIKKTQKVIRNDDKCVKFKDVERYGSKSDLEIEPYYKKDADAAIAYTSGSTGEGKGVVTSNEAINAMPIQMGITDPTFAENDILFNSLPIWVYYSLVNNIHDPLCLGVSVALDPLFEPKKISKRLSQYKYNHWNTIPSFVEGLLLDKKVEKMDLSFLKSITTGGDYLSENLKTKADLLIQRCNGNIKVGNGYGASELLGSFAYTYENTGSIKTVGKPLLGNEFFIRDLEENTRLNENEIGELYLTSPTLMKRYNSNEEATAESICIDENGKKWYKTGDLAHFDEDGNIYIDGRIRRIVLTMGENGIATKMFPDKTKNVILENKNINKCEIITIPDQKQITKPIAYIIPEEKSLLDEQELIAELKENCNEKLEFYARPTEYIIIDSIPLTPGSKADLKALEQMYYDSKDKQKIRKK